MGGSASREDRKAFQNQGRELSEPMTDHEPRLTGTKTCPDCGEDKPVIEFGVRKTSSDGLDTYCRPCKAIRTNRAPSKRPRGGNHHYTDPYW